MTVSTNESNSLFSFSRVTLLLIIFHLISSEQTARASVFPGQEHTINFEDQCRVSEPIQLAFTTVSSSCSNSSDGSIDVYIIGGTEPFTFIWSDGSMAEDLLLVKAGTYTLQVIDANGISQSGSAVIEAPEEFTVQSVITNSDVNTSTGTINILLFGGTAPYKYVWSNGENMNMISNLKPGGYSLTYTDLNGCEGNFNTEIYQLPNLSSINQDDISQSQKN